MMTPNQPTKGAIMAVKIDVVEGDIERKGGAQTKPNPYSEVVGKMAEELQASTPVEGVQRSKMRKVTGLKPGTQFKEGLVQVRRAATKAGYTALLEFDGNEDTATEFKFQLRTKIVKTRKNATPVAA
jgi:hypothetical protein